MSSKLKLKATAGGSVSLQVDDTLTTDEVLKVFSNDISSRVLTGAELTAVGIIGTSPEATLWADGSITGSSSNGNFTKWANGNLECRVLSATFTTSNALGTGVYSSNTINLTYPLVFTQTPDISYATHNAAVSYSWVAGVTIGLSSVDVRLVSIASTATNKANVTAHGRWK